MKRFLHFVAAACLAASSAMADNVVYEIDYSETPWSFYPMGYTPEVVDGVLTSENPGGWYQYFIADRIPTVVGKNYTATVKLRASKGGTAALNMGWGWGDGEQINSTINFPTEWKEVSVDFNEIGGTSSNLILQPGGFDGKIEIAWVKVALNDADFVIPTPAESDVLASYFTGNGETFGGWGASSIEAVEEDGKPCLKVVNEEAKDEWAAQIAINYDFVPGETYYINFDVKGDPFKGVPSGFQGEQNYANCGSLNKFNVTNEWTNVTIYGEPFNAGTAEAPNMPVRWLASVGKYVGTMYITNVNLYVAKSSAVEAVAPVVAPACVYNLNGVKVLDNASDLNTLPKGVYVVGGKKVVR